MSPNKLYFTAQVLLFGLPKEKKKQENYLKKSRNH